MTPRRGHKACECEQCVGACSRPGWPTPKQVRNLIILGFSDKLMLDWWEADEKLPHTFILTPAYTGSENKLAPVILPGGSGWIKHLFYSPEERAEAHCVFLTDEKKCQVHGTNGKPKECLEYLHTDTADKTKRRHLFVASLWNTDDGKDTVKSWLKTHPDVKGLRNTWVHEYLEDEDVFPTIKDSTTE